MPAASLAAAVVQRLAAAGVTAETVADDAALAHSSVRGVIDLRPLDATGTLDVATPRWRRRPRRDRRRVPRRSRDRSRASRRCSRSPTATSRDAAVAGFAKALAREWPDARVKAIAIESLFEPAAAIAEPRSIAELVGPDATVEVAAAR